LLPGLVSGRAKQLMPPGTSFPGRFFGPCMVGYVHVALVSAPFATLTYGIPLRLAEARSRGASGPGPLGKTIRPAWSWNQVCRPGRRGDAAPGLAPGTRPLARHGLPGDGPQPGRQTVVHCGPGAGAGPAAGLRQAGWFFSRPGRARTAGHAPVAL
jgi:hypothetical protein